jgi:hypothetical protein
MTFCTPRAFAPHRLVAVGLLGGVDAAHDDAARGGLPGDGHVSARTCADASITPLTLKST